ncbi:hypothetical protein ACFL26_02235, partial [Patescibacteria group bacterium]
IETGITIELLGEAPAVKSHGAIMVRNLDMVQVRCKPGALVESIQVNLERLAEIGDTITVADLEVPEGMEILNGTDEAVVVANAPRVATEAEEKAEEDAEDAEGKAAAAEGEEKKEDAAPAAAKAE